MLPVAAGAMQQDAAFPQLAPFRAIGLAKLREAIMRAQGGKPFCFPVRLTVQAGGFVVYE